MVVFIVEFVYQRALEFLPPCPAAGFLLPFGSGRSHGLIELTLLKSSEVDVLREMARRLFVVVHALSNLVEDRRHPHGSPLPSSDLSHPSDLTVRREFS